MKTFAEKLIELGGELAPPAHPGEIYHLEERIGLSLPEALRDFLRQHNGSLKETDEAIWRFWPCAEITTYRHDRDEDAFFPNNNDLRTIDPSARAVRLPASNIILFADALIDAPTYGLFHSPGHQYDGFIFDTSSGSVSAITFDAWITAFIARGEEKLLFPD